MSTELPSVPTWAVIATVTSLVTALGVMFKYILGQQKEHREDIKDITSKRQEETKEFTRTMADSNATNARLADGIQDLRDTMNEINLNIIKGTKR